MNMDGSARNLQAFRGNPFRPGTHPAAAGLRINDPNRLYAHLRVVLAPFLQVRVAVVGRKYLDDQKRRLDQDIRLRCWSEDDEIGDADAGRGDTHALFS